MIIGILKEPNYENRVSLLPEQASLLSQQKNSVMIENGAGDRAFASDAMYAEKNITCSSREEVLTKSDILLAIHPLSRESVSKLKSNCVIIGMYQPLVHKEDMQFLADTHITCFSQDMLPRTTRAQTMDILSSQANIAGYKAVVLAASIYTRYFPMLMTAAGSIAPAKVLILGAGVAGLQAIATARRLGAVVEVFDTRPAVKEEVKSLGAKFVEVEGAADATKAGGYAVEQSEEYKQKQQERISQAAQKADIIITTAQIPGKKAPLLITDETLEKMKPGSVIIDLAAATGGNTLQTKNDESVVYKNITIVGNSNLASTLPADASKLYGKNILNFLQLILSKDGELTLNFEDDIVKGACITCNGKVVNERMLKS
ncbi:MAG: Re/Si-specific NAD(P)(+) transhydrogenase subunit alpha [Bacteroidetes bacterium]|nr:Re/Si-specific NAD(P)(+) transhydrogenase subunit alpha [Bacteroidota bacterium]